MNKEISKIIFKNIFRHKNFWNAGNAKRRLHIVLLSLMPLKPCADEKTNKQFQNAREAFWSACGDSMDYKFYIDARKKIKNCSQR